MLCCVRLLTINNNKHVQILFKFHLFLLERFCVLLFLRLAHRQPFTRYRGRLTLPCCLRPNYQHTGFGFGQPHFFFFFFFFFSFLGQGHGGQKTIGGRGQPQALSLSRGWSSSSPNSVSAERRRLRDLAVVNSSQSSMM